MKFINLFDLFFPLMPTCNKKLKYNLCKIDSVTAPMII